MPQTTETISAQRERQRYVDFEYERRLTDEVTEASEKLAMVMNNSFEFAMKTDGELYFQGSSVGDVLRKSVLVAEEIVKTNPSFMTELVRRRIELQEYDEQRRLALGSEGDPDVLVVLSPIPDAVVAGVDLGAYDKHRMKTLARIYERTDDGIRSTSLSLDGTDKDGLHAIARQFGQSISKSDSSEDILAMRFWGYSSVLHDPVKTVRRRYDEQLERKHGGVWYGGRQDGEVIDALSFIRSQTDIIQAHTLVMQQIDESSVPDKKQLYKTARYNFAAALDRRKHKASYYGDGGDLSGSGEAAHSAGIEYSSDCPDGSNGQAVSAESAVDNLFGRNKEFISATCPMCGDKKVITKITGSVISGSCGCAKDICTGEEISVNRRKGLSNNQPRHHEQLRAASVEKAMTQPEVTDQAVKKEFGKYTELRTVIVMGGVSLVAYDLTTQKVIKRL